MARTYDKMFSDEEMTAYRTEKDKKRQTVEEKAAETEAAKTKARREQTRQELEERVKEAFLDAGGTAREYARLKGALVEAALIAEATRPVQAEPEPENPQVDLPLSRRQYLDR